MHQIDQIRKKFQIFLFHLNFSYRIYHLLEYFLQIIIRNKPKNLKTTKNPKKLRGFSNHLLHQTLQTPLKRVKIKNILRFLLLKLVFLNNFLQGLRPLLTFHLLRPLHHLKLKNVLFTAFFMLH